MKISSTSSYEFEIPCWCELRGPKGFVSSDPERVYTAQIDEKLVGFLAISKSPFQVKHSSYESPSNNGIYRRWDCVDGCQGRRDCPEKSPCGCWCRLDCDCDPVCEFIEVAHLEVDPGHRRTGIGAALLRMVVEDYKRHNLYLECTTDNEAAYNFYTRMGFVCFFLEEECGTPHFVYLARIEGNTLKDVLSRFLKQTGPSCELQTSFAGSSWSSDKRAFLHPG